MPNEKEIPKEICVIRTGVANLASVVAGLHRVGAETRLTDDESDVRLASAVVLPGVGAFGAGMKTLHDHGLVNALRERIEAGRPTLAVCLGLQLLLRSSEESPGVEGLGVIPEEAKRFGGDLRVPQLGWNFVQPDAACRFIEPGHAYFANSYRLVEAPTGWNCARTEHGAPFVSALERGSVLACQFHPELSGQWGLRLLRRWLDALGG